MKIETGKFEIKHIHDIVIKLNRANALLFTISN